MSQSFAPIYLHIVFSTKNRIPFLQDKELRRRVHHYLEETLRGFKCHPFRVGGVEDHVHIACQLSRQRTVSALVRDLKRRSSRWIKAKGFETTSFFWQTGYGAFSISPGHLKPLLIYISSQEVHHRQESFQDEVRRLLRTYDVEYDERRLWD